MINMANLVICKKCRKPGNANLMTKGKDGLYHISCMEKKLEGKITLVDKTGKAIIWK